MKIYLDDIRNPKTEKFDIIVRSYIQFNSILQNMVKEGIKLSYISFDHDLGEDKSGLDCCKLLVNTDLDYNILAEDFSFNVHSANPVGKQNIESLLNNYLKYKKEELN